MPQNDADEPADVLLEGIREQRAELVKQKKAKAPKGGESRIYQGTDGSWYERRGKGEVKCIDEEIPFDIPESWAWARLSLFGEFSSGKTPQKGDVSLYGDSVNWVTSKDVKTFWLKSTGIRLSEKGASDLRLHPAGTMVFVVRSGILKRMLPISILIEPSTVNQDIKAFSLVDPQMGKYLAYFIKAFEPHILKDLTKHVTTVDSLRFGQFAAMPIPVPPLAEQERIVARIDEIMSMFNKIQN